MEKKYKNRCVSDTTAVVVYMENLYTPHKQARYSELLARSAYNMYMSRVHNKTVPSKLSEEAV